MGRSYLSLLGTMSVPLAPGDARTRRKHEAIRIRRSRLNKLPQLCLLAAVLAAVTGCGGGPITKPTRRVIRGDITVDVGPISYPQNPTGTTIPVTISGVLVTPTTGIDVGGHRVTIWVDGDGDGNIDVDEDTDGDGDLDPGEDVDGDGKLDTAEPFIQETTAPPPNGIPPAPPTIPGTINVPKPPPGGKVRLRVRVEMDAGDDGEPLRPRIEDDEITFTP